MPEFSLRIDDHPSLRVAAFTSTFPSRLDALDTPRSVLDGLLVDAPAPLQRDESVRAAVRDMLRHGGYKPTCRGKPASEYLLRASTEGTLGSINLTVGVCNVVSLHSGFPISIVDVDRARTPLHVGIAPEGASYVFNASGQTIDVAGLVCLFDADGPCANAVRDAQRTKTRAETTTTLGVIWGCAGLEERLQRTQAWYRALLHDVGVRTDDVAISTGAST